MVRFGHNFIHVIEPRGSRCESGAVAPALEHRLQRGVEREQARVVGAEQRLRAIDRQLLCDVYKLAATVITLTWIALSIFIGQLRSLRLHYCR